MSQAQCLGSRAVGWEWNTSCPAGRVHPGNVTRVWQKMCGLGAVVAANGPTVLSLVLGMVSCWIVLAELPVGLVLSEHLVGAAIACLP